MQGFHPWVSLRLGHATALTATGSHSRPWRRFATPLKPFLKKGLENPKNLQKMVIYQSFLKVLGDSKEPFFKKVLWWGAGAKPPDKRSFSIGYVKKL